MTRTHWGLIVNMVKPILIAVLCALETQQPEGPACFCTGQNLSFQIAAVTHPAHHEERLNDTERQQDF